jgi:hypothetical protein
MQKKTINQLLQGRLCRILFFILLLPSIALHTATLSNGGILNEIQHSSLYQTAAEEVDFDNPA